MIDPTLTHHRPLRTLGSKNENNPHSGSKAAQLSGSQGRRLYHVRLEVVVIAVAVTPLPALKHLLFVLPIHLRVHGNGWISELVCGGRVEDNKSGDISQPYFRHPSPPTRRSILYVSAAFPLAKFPLSSCPTDLTLPITSSGKYGHHLPFTDRETEAQKENDLLGAIHLFWGKGGTGARKPGLGQRLSFTGSFLRFLIGLALLTLSPTPWAPLAAVQLILGLSVSTSLPLGMKTKLDGGVNITLLLLFDLAGAALVSSSSTRWTLVFCGPDQQGQQQGPWGPDQPALWGGPGKWGQLPTKSIVSTA